jgi:hypothetical protein
MKTYFLIFISLFSSSHSFSQAMQKDSIYHSHDSTFEIKTWKELNIIREFIRFEGKEDIYYKEFDFNTQQLKVEGLLKNGLCSGTWKFYKKKGKFDHEIKFEPVHTKSYTTAAGPYTDVFKHIKQKCDSLLEQKKEKNCNFLFHFHSSQSYYYRSGFRKNGNTFKDAQPNAFLMRYDLVFDDGQIYRTFAYVELELDSTGTIKKKNYRSLITGNKNIDFIDLKSAASNALKHGLKDTDQPFGFEFRFVADSSSSKQRKLILRVGGHPFDVKEEKDQGWLLTTVQFRYVDMDPWTGEVIGSGSTSREERKIP